MVDAAIRFLDGPLAENPGRVTRPLGGHLEGYRSGYVGISYSVLVRIDQEAGRVYVIDIDHRANVYG